MARHSPASVPFYSQIVNWKGEDSGFPTSAVAQEWQANACGIACLRMVVGALCHWHTESRPTYWQLLSMGLARDAYNDRGWIHQGLLGIAEAYGLSGRCHRQKTVADLVAAIARQSICIASVTVGFLGGQEDPSGRVRPRGGHLVVAYDVVESRGGPRAIVCNHPSSREEWNHAGWEVPVRQWETSFSGSFIEFRADSSSWDENRLPKLGGDSAPR
jgi:hypothetical protein